MATQSTFRAPVSESFGLLPEPRRRFGSFSVSLAANGLLAFLFVWIALLQLHKKPVVPRYESTSLVFPTTPPPPPLPPVPHVIVAPPPMPLISSPPKIVPPKPLPEPPKPESVHMNTPAMPSVPVAPPKAVVAPPQAKVGLFASAKPTAVANNQVAPSVQTGGFGNPSGAAVNPNATRPSNVEAVGSFSAAPGANLGAGAARPGVVQAAGFGSGVAHGVPGGTSRGEVASAGFANGAAGGSPGGRGTSRNVVATGGFGTTGIGNSGATVVKAEQAAVVPPVVLSEPRPRYTEEARQLKIQGEVTLQVKFGADGRVEVLRVINGLGHGLDEQAEQVARQIRFKPAARNGQPTDQVTLIHILFQLA